MTVYTLTLTTLSPLHIGDGNELRQGFDFIVHQGRTYRLNVDAILAAYSARMLANRSGSYPPPGELLTEDDKKIAEYFRYSLSGSPHSQGSYKKVVRSCIKDVFDYPYIPGSSLKGALRTALAWTGWSEVNPSLNRDILDNKKEYAGQPLERKLFGDDPNHDLLRALQISDLTSNHKPQRRLVLLNARVLTQRSAASPVELEAIAGDTRFTGTLRIDHSLFSPAAERELKFAKHRHWLDELMPRVQKHSRARIAELTAWYEHAENCAAVARFYRQLANAQLPPNQALVQLGWGSGWDGKTFWTHLQKDAHLFEQLVGDFRMHKAGRTSPPRRAGDPFPRSKRAVMKIVEGRSAPLAPMGWALIEITPQ